MNYFVITFNTWETYTYENELCVSDIFLYTRSPFHLRFSFQSFRTIIENCRGYIARNFFASYSNAHSSLAYRYENLLFADAYRKILVTYTPSNSSFYPKRTKFTKDENLLGNWFYNVYIITGSIRSQKSNFLPLSCFFLPSFPIFWLYELPPLLQKNISFL